MSTLLDTASLIVTPNGAKSGKLYSVVPSSGAGDLDVTRATTATRVNSSGLIESVGTNIPRLDYSNGSCPSILVEPQRTNVLTYSEALTPNFTFNQCSITSNQISPDGTNNAKRITNGATATDVYFEQSVGISVNTYTWSAYVKKGTDTSATIKPVHVGIGGDVSLMTFTFATETIVTSAAITTSGFTKLTNGWYRIFCTVPITLAVISLRGRFGNSNTPNVYNEWFGVQLEVGSYATSYIPTTSASVTRNADVIGKTGISSLIGTEFTLFLDAYETIGGTSTRYVVLKGTGGAYANALLIESNSSNQLVVTLLNSGSSTIFGAISGSLTNGQRFKIAVTCKNNDFAVYVNGVQIATQTSGSVPTTSDLYLGYYTDYSDNYSKINTTALWKQRLTNSQLSQLTTI